MGSIWTDTVKLPSFPTLKKDLNTDVLIIGGGMAGVLCAFFLHQRGVKYTLLEAAQIASGTTGHTTAKITAQHGLIYQKLLAVHGVEKARKYLDANLKALKIYENLCQKIDCDFVTSDSYVYTREHPEKIKKELDALKKLGYSALFTRKPELPFDSLGAVGFSNQAQFHPLKFLAGIVPGLNIYEHSKVLGIDGTNAITESGKITAKKIIVATHYPFVNRHGNFFLKMYQQRSYVLALKDVSAPKDMYVDEKTGGLSFRRYKDVLLFGGFSRRTGTNGGTCKDLHALAKQYYPKCSVIYEWATQDCIPLDHMPYIGPYSKFTPNLFTATGFQKWGMTSSMMAAQILSDLVLEQENPYANLFSPSRSILHPQLGLNLCESFTHMLPMTSRRCSHLGCAMKWNPVEHSWDCPCHGSRFNKEGEVLDNPANRTLKKRC